MRITFSLLFLATATLARANETSLPLIDTTSGLIRGHSAPNRTCVAEFLGIKYAAAPIGELRFAPPNRFTAPSGAFYEASKWVRDHSHSCDVYCYC